MTRFGFDWQWDYENGTWCIYPHADEEQEHADFLAGLNAKDKANE